VHIKAVADLLGHSSIAITGDVYGHTSEDTAGAAVAASRDGSGCELNTASQVRQCKLVWPFERVAVGVERRAVQRLITRTARPSAVPAAVAQASLMSHEHLVRAKGVTVGYLVEPSGTWSIGSWTVRDCQLLWPGAGADRRVVSRRQE
jgi:hypothetical protein